MALEKLTPTKFSAPRNITGTKDGRAYSFFSAGFLTREHGDKKWFNIAYNQDNPLKEGQTYELEIKERTYQDKEGNTKTAYDAKLPTKESEMSRAIMNLGVEVGKLRQRIEKVEGMISVPGKAVHVTPAQYDEPPTEDDSSLPF